MSRIRQDKIQEALELLNEAAQDKKEELYEMINDKYAYFKELLAAKTEDSKEVVGQAKKELLKALEEEEEKMIRRAKSIDKKVRHNPWPVLGIVAVSSIVFGIIMGKK